MMSSFELKPQASTNDTSVNMTSLMMGGNKAMAKALPTVNDIVWTYPRSPVPPQLVGRVTDGTWARTFDGVQARIRDNLDFERAMLEEGPGSGMPLLCMCCDPTLCCGPDFEQLEAQEQSARREWLSLLKTEQERYRPVGVHVTLAKEVRMYGAGSHRNLNHETVGLKFEVGPYQPAVFDTTTTSTTAHQTITRDGKDGIVAQLVTLNQLLKMGALSDEEYAAAKSKLLQE